MTRRLLLTVAFLLGATSALAQPVSRRTVDATRLRLFDGGLSTNCTFSTGTGSPEGVVSGKLCDIYVRQDGTADTTVYIKGSGTAASPTATGWVANGTSGGAGSGSVTSVDVSVPSSTFSSVGGPITTAGTIAVSFVNQSANTVLAGPSSGVASTPAWRKIVFGDWASNSCASGQIPKFDGTAWACSDDAGASTGAPTAAPYVTKTPDATLTGEFALSTLATGLLKNTTGTGVPTIAVAGTDYADPAALNASNLTSGTVPAARMPALTGDVTTAAGAVATTIANDAVTSAKIDDGTIVFGDWSLNSCTAGQVAKVNAGGTAWECAADATGGGGGTVWSDLSTPGANLSLSMGAFTTAFTWGSATSTGNLFALSDTASNTGTGYLFSVGTAASSTLKPFRVQWQGDDRITVDQNGDIVLGAGWAGTEVDAGNSGTALTVDWRDGNQQIITLTGNVTLTLSNPQVGGVYRLILVQDATGNRTVTWPGSVKWPADTAPTIDGTAAAVTLCAFTFTTLGADGYLGTCGADAYSQP